MSVSKSAFVSERADIGKCTIVQTGAVIEDDCKIGRNCRIGYHAVLRKGTVIGDNSIFGTHSVSEGLNKIGNHVTIHSQCHITQTVEIDDWVFIAPFFCGANTRKISHGRDYNLVKEGYRIKAGARIAIGVLVMPAVTIGREALIGAGSLITRDIPDYAIAYGSPAKVVGVVPPEERLKRLESK
jgi:acetyltransferase-like isoleucine patch superfamily enzyme